MTGSAGLFLCYCRYSDCCGQYFYDLLAHLQRLRHLKYLRSNDGLNKEAKDDKHRWQGGPGHFVQGATCCSLQTSVHMPQRRDV